MSNVTLRNVRKVYPNGFNAVKDFSLEIKDKEFIVFVGPSGCGKSTTLRMIAGLETISGGTIEIDGRVVNNVVPKDRDIAMVFQNYALYPHMSVYENMAFGLKLRKIPRKEIDARIQEAATILGLENLLERRPKMLSGGQRQRVAVGRAIVRRPKAFLFDEPLSNLDAKMRVQMRVEISRLHKQLNATMIYVTHDQTEAMTMGDRIVVMEDGYIRQAAEPMEVYNHPANLFTAGFVGTPAMNFFKGKVVAKGESFEFATASLSIPLPREWNAAASQLVGLDGCTLGVRPEDVTLAEQGSAPLFSSQLHVVEPMGAETYLYGEIGGINFTSRVPGFAPGRAGQALPFNFRMSGAHLFAPDGTAAV